MKPTWYSQVNRDINRKLHMLKWRNHPSSPCNLTGTVKYNLLVFLMSQTKKKNHVRSSWAPLALLLLYVDTRHGGVETSRAEKEKVSGDTFFVLSGPELLTLRLQCGVSLAWHGLAYSACWEKYLVFIFEMIGGDYLPVNWPKLVIFVLLGPLKTVVQRKLKTWLQKRLDMLCSTGVKPKLWNSFVKFLR